MEHLRGEIRELEKENRQLKRRLTKYEKNKHLYNNVIQDYEEMLVAHVDTDDIKTEKRKECPDCGKGHLDEYAILDKIFGTCDVCGFRKKLN